jgi:hypothetical protein
MMLAPRRRIRLSEVAEAVGSTLRSVRHWFSKYGDRGLVPQADQSGTWLEFSWGDVAIVALAKYLVDIGMSAPEAFDRAKATLEAEYPQLFDAEPRWMRGMQTFFVYLGRDRSGEWVTNNPDIRCPLRVIIDVDQIILEAFDALGDMGHEPPIDNSKASDRLARNQLSKRQREFLVRLDQLRAGEDPSDILQHVKRLQAAADSDEASWMAEQFSKLFPPDGERESEDA